MQSVDECPVTKYRHRIEPLQVDDNVSLLGSGNIFNDTVVLSILIEVKTCRAIYWEQQPLDHQRFGRREAMARDHSIKVVGLAITAQEESERRNRPVEWNSPCTVM